MFLCRLAFFSRRNWHFDTPDENNGILRSILSAGLRNNAKRWRMCATSNWRNTVFGGNSGRW